MDMSLIAVGYVDKTDVDLAKKIAKKWQLEYIGDSSSAAKHPQLLFLLQVNFQQLELIKLDEPKLGGIKVDFVDGAVVFRSPTLFHGSFTSRHLQYA